MRKFLLILSAALLTATQASAEHIGLSDAIKAASQAGAATRVATAPAFKLAQTLTSTDNNTECLYVLNREDGNGFVIAAADDCAFPILGYCDNGSYDPDNVPANVSWWLGKMRDEIAYGIKNGIKTDVTAATSTSRADIEPLCATKWNQNAPYNNLCPKKGTQTCYTGCVATAMAQVLKQREYPMMGVGSHTYTPNGFTTAYTANFGDTYYEWGQMKNTYSSATAAQKEAVATLMFHCGVAVDMNYGTGASGAYTQNVPRAFVTYFDYDKSIQYREREFYGYTDWCNLIHTELSANGPVYYAGSDDGGGHAFVCDGYRNSDGFFHYNWGWGGDYDGYFKVSALAPENQGIGGNGSTYNYGQSIMVNVKPNENGTMADPQFLVGSSTGFAYKSATSSAVSFSLGAYQQTTACLNVLATLDSSKDTETIVFGVRAHNAVTGKDTYIDANTSANYSALSESAFYYMSNPAFSVQKSRLTALPDGTYHLYPTFKRVADSYRDDMMLPVGVAKYVIMNVSNGQLNFSSPVIENTIRVNNVSLASDIFIQKKATKITGTATGISGEYLGEVYAALINEAGDQVVYNEYRHIDVEAGSSENLSFTFTVPATADGTAINPGNYYFAFLIIGDDGYAHIVSDITPVIVRSAASTGTLTVDQATITNSDNVDLDNFTLNTKVSISGGAFQDNLYMLICDAATDSIVDGDIKFVNLATGKTGIYTYNQAIDCQIGHQYYAVLCTLNSTRDAYERKSDKMPFTVTNKSAIDAIGDSHPAAAYSGTVRVYDTAGHLLHTAPAEAFSIADVNASGVLIIKSDAGVRKVIR